MIPIGEFKIGNTELAKVLHYYGFLEETNEYKIVCPFHEDVNASMQVKLNEGSFYCFGCGESGNALRFVMLANKRLNDLESCFKLFKILKSKKVKNIKVERASKPKVENVEALNEAKDYYYGLKKTDWLEELRSNPERLYLRKRGFSAQTLNKCRAKINYNNSYPIIFPMFDLGEFRGWVCRTTSSSIAKKRKYLYNTGFIRSNTLVGTYDSDTVMLVEGYMDWLKMKQFGVDKVTAILGWKITDQQIQKLKQKGVKTIISALDNDECGIKGTMYLKKYFEVIRFQFPDGIKDPGDMNIKTFSLVNDELNSQIRRTQNGINGRFEKSGKKSGFKQR